MPSKIILRAYSTAGTPVGAVFDIARVLHQGVAVLARRVSIVNFAPETVQRGVRKPPVTGRMKSVFSGRTDSCCPFALLFVQVTALQPDGILNAVGPKSQAFPAR